MKTSRAFTLLLLLLAGVVTAQDIFFEPSRRHYPVAGLPWAIETADFNNDGNLDFVTASRLERAITLRFGNGDGTFTDSINIPVGISPRTLITGTFDADTNVDIAVANLLSDDVTVLLGDGNGGFPQRFTYAVGSRPRSIITADFNGDSNNDLAVANRDANSISILPGNGDGTFGTALDAPTSRDINPRQIRSGDLNNDTFQDIVMVHDEQQGAIVGQKYAVLMGRGDGTFDPVQVYIVNAGNGFPEAVSLTLGYFDGNDNLDMAISLNNSDIDELVSYSGNGDGTFTQLAVISLGTAPFHIVNLDLNKDGFPDIVVANTSSNRLTLHTNRGNGTFRNAIPGGDLFNYRNSTFRVGNGPRWVTIADLNNDALPDLLTANEQGNDVSILIADSDTTFVTAPRYDVGSPPQAFPSGGVASDFDNDSDIDLAISNWGASYDSSNVSVPLNNGDGTFSERINYRVGVNPDEVIAQDVNSDGVEDLIVLNTRDSVFSVLPGIQGGRFAQAIGFSLKPNPAIILSMRDIDMGDFNEDGLQDVVIVNYNEDDLALFFGDPQNIFSEVTKRSLTNARPERLVVADFNLDGHQDILVQKDAQFIGQNTVFEVFLGDGSGMFSDPVITGWSGENTIRILSADMDGDNIPDMAVLDSKFQINLNTLILFRGNGDGTFIQANNYELTDPSGFIAGNYSGDANTDLLIGSFASGDLTILQGAGDFTFRELWPSYGTGTGVVYFTPGDFDRDGDIDLATTGGIFSDSYTSILNNISNLTAISQHDAAAPQSQSDFLLEQNFPNPFNPTTRLKYSLKKSGRVRLQVFNVLGQLVRTLVDAQQTAGYKEVQWDGANDQGVKVSSGIYIYRLQAGDYLRSRKMILMK